MMGKKPAIRFEGYTEDWEQRKFGDLACRSSDSMTSNSENPCVEYEDIVSEQGYLNKDVKLKDVAKTGIFFNGGNVLYGKLRPYLHNWLNPDFNGVAVGDWWVLKPIEMECNFLYRLIQTQQFDEVANQTSGTKMPRADWDLVSNTLFCVPSSFDEQKKISDTFDSFDTLITLHQRNYEMMMTTKKSMLEKLFPQGDAKVPAIRFEGFVGEWEKKPLGELFVEYSEKEHEELPPLMIVQGGGTVLRSESDRKLVYNKENLSGYKLVREGDFIVHLRSFEGGLEIATTTGIISPAYHTFHGESVDSDFYYAYFRSRKFIDIDLSRHVYGIRDGRSIDINGMKTILIPYTSLEEQKQIAGYLNSLDDLIELYRIRVEKLKNIKAACLQGMFA